MENPEGGENPPGLVDGAAAAAAPAAPAVLVADMPMGDILKGLATVMHQMIQSQQKQSDAIVQAITNRRVGSVDEMAMPIALRKLQERSPEFPTYDGNAENFMWWLATVEERRKLRGIPDEVAITFATEALGSHSRGVITPEHSRMKWPDFVAYLKTRFCADSYEYSLLWRLQHLRVDRGQFPLFHSTFVTGVSLLEGSSIATEAHLAYYYLQGLEHDMQAKLLPKKLTKLAELYQEAWSFFRKPRTNPTVIMVAGKKGRATAIPAGGPAGMDLDSVQVDPRVFLTEVTGSDGRTPIFATTTPANLFTNSTSSAITTGNDAGFNAVQPLFAKSTQLMRPPTPIAASTIPVANAANIQSQNRVQNPYFAGRGNGNFNTDRGQGRGNNAFGRSTGRGGRPTGPVRRSSSSDDKYRRVG